MITAVHLSASDLTKCQYGGHVITTACCSLLEKLMLILLVTAVAFTRN